MRPSRSNPSGWKPGIPASHGSRPEYDVSVCPLNISVGPSPVPARVARTFARPSSTCCHCTASPSSSQRSPYQAAIASSDPVKLGIETAARASATRRSRSITASSRSEVWQHLLPEEADLVVPLIAPELEHDVRAAGVAVLLDRRDAVGRRAGDRLALVEDRIRHLVLGGEASAPLHRLGDGADLVLRQLCEVEQGVGGALDVLHLVREVHAGDLTGAVAALVAVFVDRGDDRAADVDVGA